MYDIDKELAELLVTDKGALTALEATIVSACVGLDVMLGEGATTLITLESSLDNAINAIDGFMNIEVPKPFTLAAFESVLDQAIAELDTPVTPGALTLAALEAFLDESINNIDVADESQSVSAQLLAIAKKNIDQKCNSLEACESMMMALATEATKFNDCMLTMAQAGRDLKSGSISQEQFKEIIAPSITELKANCSIISSVDPEYAAEGTTVTDDEITTIREFMIGMESLIGAKKEEFAVEPEPAKETEDTSLESFIESCEKMTIATEGVVTYSFRTVFSEKRREAKKLMKEAKEFLKEKKYDSAVGNYKKAKELFESLVKELNKIPETEFSHVTGTSEGKKTDLKSTANMFASKAIAKSYLESKVQSCDEAIFKVKNAQDKSKRKATESFDAEIDTFIAELAMESTEVIDDEDEDDDEDLDIDELIEDDDDLDESSFDCYLK